MLKIFGIAFATLICVLFLRDKSPQFAAIISVTGACIVCAVIVSEIKSLSAEINAIMAQIPSSVSYVRLMIKILLMSILTQLISDICRDNGESSIASAVEIAAKIIIITMVLPLFKTIITLILGLVK